MNLLINSGVLKDGQTTVQVILFAFLVLAVQHGGGLAYWILNKSFLAFSKQALFQIGHLSSVSALPLFFKHRSITNIKIDSHTFIRAIDHKFDMRTIIQHEAGMRNIF